MSCYKDLERVAWIDLRHGAITWKNPVLQLLRDLVWWESIFSLPLYLLFTTSLGKSFLSSML